MANDNRLTEWAKGEMRKREPLKKYADDDGIVDREIARLIVQIYLAGRIDEARASVVGKGMLTEIAQAGEV